MPEQDISTQPARIGLLLIDGFAMLSYASFIEPFRAANALAGRPLYRWTHIGRSGHEAIASNGARLTTDVDVGEPLACDMLFVFAAGDPSSFNDDVCFAWLRMLARDGVRLGGVSGGPYLLARAGLLGRRRATIHWEHAEALRAAFPDLRLEPGLFVIDGDRMTCAGGAAGVDLALCLIEADHGKPLARRVGEWFIRPDARDATSSQRGGPADRHGTTDVRLLRMLAAMEAAYEDPVSRDALAARAGVSVRQLERLCVAAFRQSVSEKYLALRLDRAAALLRSTGAAVTEIAVACGFQSLAHFSRRFRARFGKSASAMKRMRNLTDDRQTSEYTQI